MPRKMRFELKNWLSDEQKVATKWLTDKLKLANKYAPVIQTIILIVMAFTLFQNAETLRLLDRQWESGIEPVLDMAMSPSPPSVRISNVGIVEVSNIEMVGNIGAYFDTSTQRISAYNLNRGHLPLRNKLSRNETFDIDLSLYRIQPPVPPSAESMAVYSFILRYRRAADMKPFILQIPFTYSKDSATGTIDIYLPLFNVSKGKTADKPDVLVLSRRELARIYEAEIALGEK